MFVNFTKALLFPKSDEVENLSLMICSLLVTFAIKKSSIRKLCRIIENANMKRLLLESKEVKGEFCNLTILRVSYYALV